MDRDFALADALTTQAVLSRALELALQALADDKGRRDLAWLDDFEQRAIAQIRQHFRTEIDGNSFPEPGIDDAIAHLQNVIGSIRRSLKGRSSDDLA